MSLRISYFRKGAKNTTKEERLSPLRDIEKQKTSDLTRGGTSDYKAHDSIIPSFYGRSIIGCAGVGLARVFPFK